MEKSLRGGKPIRNTAIERPRKKAFMSPHGSEKRNGLPSLLAVGERMRKNKSLLQKKKEKFSIWKRRRHRTSEY